MATRSKETEASSEAIKAAILDAVSELWDEHEQQITNIRNRSEDQKITVNFSNDIDCSESESVVETKIRFTESFTDKRTNKITKDDQNQLKFETVENAGRGGRQNDPEPGDEPPHENEEPAPTVDEAVEALGGVKEDDAA